MPHESGKRIPSHKRAKHTGKGKDHSFLRLPHFMLNSHEFDVLPPNAIKLLLHMAAAYNGRNNGNLNMVWNRLEKRGWVSEGTLNRAKQALLSARFLRCTRHGGKNRCSLYAITWEPIDSCERAQLEVPPQRVASHDWRNPCSHHRSKSLSKSEQSQDFGDGVSPD